MIKFMTGTPGSGKSHGMAFHIRNLLIRGKNVISTVNMNLNQVTRNGRIQIGSFQYIPIFELTPEKLERYALHNHIKGRESQTYVFVDECQLIFNSRDYSNKDRKAWLVFFTSHRHYGFEFFLITQNDRMIDRQIRALVEHEVRYKKINNRLWFLPLTVFVAIEYWYGNTPKQKMRHEFILFRRSIARMYDSYTLFDDLIQKYADEDIIHSHNHSEHPTCESNYDVAGVAGTEAGVRGTRLRDCDTRSINPTPAHPLHVFSRWLVSPLKLSKIKE